jgi:transcriptional regulator with XRE-family HTH domain
MNTILTTPADAFLLAMARERLNGRAAHRIAAAMGIHPSLLSMWLNGRRQPSPAQADHLAEVLGIPAAELFPQVARNDHSPASSPVGKEHVDRARHPL